MSKLLISICFFLVSAPLRALTVKVETIDASKTYAAIKDTETVKYMERCERKKFDMYEWKTWEGYYSARAYILPIAYVTVRREPEEIFGGDQTPFIKRAQAECGKIGSNLYCLVRVKKNPQILEPDAMIFLAHKQIFQSGNSTWEAFFGDIMTKGILLTLYDIQAGEKTREILEKQKSDAQKKP